MSLIITNAGLDASIDAGNLGVSYKITHIGIGLNGYIPNIEQTALQNEVIRCAITRGSIPRPGQLHFETVFDGNEEFEGKEIGYYLEDGTLFAIDSRDGDILSLKHTNTILTEAFELNLASSAIENITVEIIGSPYATETVAGIAKIVTEAQVDKGTDDSAFLTIKKFIYALASSYATETVAGVAKIATEAQVSLAENDTTIVTPLKLQAKIDAFELKAQYLPYSALRTYKTGEVCTIEVDGEVQAMQMYAGPNLTCINKDPTDLSNRHEQWADASSPFWWVPYTGTEVGTPFWWLSETAPESAVMEINADLPTAVYWRLARRYPDLVTGETINTGEIRGEFLRVLDQGRGVDVGRAINSGQFDATAPNGIFSRGQLISASAGTSAFALNSSGAGELDVETFKSTDNETRPRNIARAMAITI
ncbi:MAG: phage tail protein [Psychromonas sp.]